MSVTEVRCNESVYFGCCSKLWLLGNECGSWETNVGDGKEDV